MARDKRQVLLGFIRSRWDAEQDGLVRDEEFVKALKGVRQAATAHGSTSRPARPLMLLAVAGVASSLSLCALCR